MWGRELDDIRLPNYREILIITQIAYVYFRGIEGLGGSSIFQYG